MYITAQGCRLRNDLYCVEWDVKLYYTHVTRDSRSQAALLTAALTREADAGDRENIIIGHGKLPLRCVCSARRRLGAHGGEDRGGGISCRHAHRPDILLLAEEFSVVLTSELEKPIPVSWAGI